MSGNPSDPADPIEEAMHPIDDAMFRVSGFLDDIPDWSGIGILTEDAIRVARDLVAAENAATISTIENEARTAAFYGYGGSASLIRAILRDLHADPAMTVDLYEAQMGVELETAATMRESAAAAETERCIAIVEGLREHYAHGFTLDVVRVAAFDMALSALRSELSPPTKEISGNCRESGPS